MNRLETRVIKLEGIGRNGWRAYAGVPVGQVPDSALLGRLGEAMGWPSGYVPSDAELLAIASGKQPPADDGGAP